jgi:tetratricopeptide (TPR) repeat protein
MLGDEATARATLQRAIEQAPTAAWSASARQAVAILDINTATISSAVKPTLDKALADKPDDPVALSRLAALQEREGKLDLAIASLEAALKASTHNVSLMLKLAQLHGSAKNPAKALEYAKAARKQAPDDPDVARSLGRLAYQNGDRSWSVSLLQEAMRKQQASPDLLFDFAQASYSVGRITEAQQALRDALALAAKQTLTGFARAEEAREMLELIALAENSSEAVRQASVIERALKQNPLSVPALMAAGSKSEQRQESDEARQSYNKALTIFPDFAPAKKRLVALGASQKEFDQRTYDLALQVRTAFPNDSLTLQVLGIQTYLKGDFSRSVTLLRESIAARENDADGYYYYGLAQRRQGDTAFIKSLQKALELGLKDQKLAEEARKLLSEVK